MQQKLYQEILSTCERGARNEDLAARYFERLGYMLIQRNFRWKGGEIDLIFQDPAQTLVFVEVRSVVKKSPWLRYTIHPAKQRRLIRTAQTYLFRHAWARKLALRFDLVWIEAGKLEHWKNVMHS